VIFLDFNIYIKLLKKHNFGFQNVQTLSVISGGIWESQINDELSITDAVISTKNGSKFETLPSLPRPIMHHCLVIIDSETIFTTGGWDGSRQNPASYIFTKSRLALIVNHYYNSIDVKIHFRLQIDFFNFKSERIGKMKKKCNLIFCICFSCL
jgi:hypothetical protein